MPDLTYDGDLLQDQDPTDDDLEKARIDDILDEDDEDESDLYTFTGDEDVEDIDSWDDDLDSEDISDMVDDELLEPGR